jgi:hypothetical protein
MLSKKLLNQPRILKLCFLVVTFLVITNRNILSAGWQIQTVDSIGDIVGTH